MCPRVLFRAEHEFPVSFSRISFFHVQISKITVFSEIIVFVLCLHVVAPVVLCLCVISECGFVCLLFVSSCVHAQILRETFVGTF